VSNASITYSAQNKSTGSTDALRLTQYAGEVLTAFESKRIMRELIRTRSISGGKTAQFPAVFKTWAGIHTPGTELLGQQIDKTEITVTADGLLISDLYVDRIDEMLTHYDLRAPYAEAQGHAIGRAYDAMASQLVAASAYGAELFTGDGGGTQVTESASQDFDASGSDLIDALNTGKLTMEQKDVDVDNLNAVFLPLQWALIANSDQNINQDFGGEGSVARQVLRTVSDITIHKSNAFLFGKDVTPYNASTNADGLVGHPTDPRRLPANLPTKYHRDMARVRGLLFSPDAAAMLHVLDLNTEATWDARRRATLLIAEMCAGGDPLRTKCAAVLQTA
jgi:hypothetical protein